MKTQHHVGEMCRSFALVLGASSLCFFAPTSMVGQSHTPLVDPIPAGIPVSPITIGLEPVMTGLVSPVGGSVAPGDPNHLYISDQTGVIWSVDISGRREAPAPKVFLDLSSRLIALGLGPLKYDERGLLGLAFHPDFEDNGLFYTYASEPVNGTADFSTMQVNNPSGQAANCQNVLLEWRVQDPEAEDGVAVDLSSARELLRIDKAYINHNGGALTFGPDRLLYISLGDGGNANDQGIGHTDAGNGQTLVAGNVLGKILRINPLGRNSANGKYGIPRSNPFADKKNPLPGPHEIYAYGFRNPWRMSFDSETGQLYVGDVGQNDVEEVDIVKKGGNYGWPVKEGTFLFDTTQPGRAGEGFVWANTPDSPEGLIDPIAEYDHADGEQPPFHSTPDTRVAVIGGFVYHGHKIRAVRDKYVFGDYSAEIGAPVAGHLYVLTGPNRAIAQLNIQGRPELGLAVLGFAQDHKGELYLLANQTGTLLGNTGVVLKLTPIGGEDEN
jgi:glucose/arabinose dehydrogenase